MNKITLSFVFPVTNGVMGGVQMLLINLISFISSNELANVRLYDYRNGLIKTELDRMGVTSYEFIDIGESSWLIPNLGDELFVLTNSMWLVFSMFFKNRKNVKIAVWDVFYPFWDTLGTIRGLKIPSLRKALMAELGNNNAIFFMEEKGLNKFKSEGFFLGALDRVVPIPVFTHEKNLYLEMRGKEHNKIIKIAYVGRSVDWKIYPVKKIIEDLGRLKINAILIIYTHDERIFSSFFDDIPDCIQVVFKTGFWGDKLEEDLLINNFDFGYAMGTAALDMAKLGVPTILADFAFKDFPEDCKYRLLHSTPLGNLGQDIYEASDLSKISLEEILSLDRCEWSSNSFAFVCNNHSIDICAKKMTECAESSNMFFHNINNLIHVPFVFSFLLRKIIKSGIVNQNYLFSVD